MPPKKAKNVTPTATRTSKRRRAINGPDEEEVDGDAEAEVVITPERSIGNHVDQTLQHPKDEPHVSAVVEGSVVQSIVGYCFCKDWRVEIKEPISGVVVCHCKDCQAISSSFFCTFLTVKSRSLLTVEPRDRDARNVLSSTFYYEIKDGDNAGRKQSRTFCSRCGTVLFATPESLEGALPVNRNLFVGDENDKNPLVRDILSPKIEIFVKDRAPWRPGDQSVLHEYVSMPVGMGGGGGSAAGPSVKAATAAEEGTHL